MSSSKRQVDAFKRQREARRRAYAEAGCLRERFPDVEQVILEITFTDRRGIGTYSSQLHTFSPSAKAFFEVACPRTLCIDGGFDLANIILGMLARDGSTSTGTLECNGWLDPAHTETAHCILQMHYRLEARYKIAKPSDSSHPKRP
jgi:hypothetical protein